MTIACTLVFLSIVGLMGCGTPLQSSRNAPAPYRLFSDSCLEISDWRTSVTIHWSMHSPLHARILKPLSRSARNETRDARPDANQRILERIPLSWPATFDVGNASDNASLRGIKRFEQFRFVEVD